MVSAKQHTHLTTQATGLLGKEANRQQHAQQPQRPGTPARSRKRSGSPAALSSPNPLSMGPTPPAYRSLSCVKALKYRSRGGMRPWYSSFAGTYVMAPAFTVPAIRSVCICVCSRQGVCMCVCVGDDDTRFCLAQHTHAATTTHCRYHNTLPLLQHTHAATTTHTCTRTSRY